MKKYKIDKFDRVLVDNFKDNDDNSYICETAGFIPLDVKFKRFEQAGVRAQFSASEFTSQDYRDMYMSPNFEISPNDDLETVVEKTQAQQMFIMNLKKSKLSDFVESERTERSEVREDGTTIAKSNFSDKNMTDDEKD